MSIISKLLPAIQTSRSAYLFPAAVQRTRLSFVQFHTSETGQNKGLAKSQERADVSTEVKPLGEKVKEATKTISYTGVILVGLGVTGVIFFYVFRELFSSNIPNSIYSEALEKCKKDPRVEDALGAPIKGYGEETTRRRRTRVSHAIYEKDGIQHMRMRFNIKGVRNKGIAELDMKMDEFGRYVCRYLIVTLDDYSGSTFIIEDNRDFLDRPQRSGLGSSTEKMPTFSLTN